MKLRVILFALLSTFAAKAQYYFPPVTGNTWDTVSPASLGWCAGELDSLYGMLESKQTKAFIILKDGRIAAEKYFGTFSRDSAWFWASAGKTLTAFLIGIARQEQLLSLDDSVSRYLGLGWTSCSAAQEGKITIRNQLTMTTGLNYQVSDLDCKLPACLTYKAEAGTQWYYHNAPYLLLQDVIEHASGLTYQQYTSNRLSAQTGISGLWYDGVFYSKARSMARFGSLVLNRGKWASTTVLNDTAYFREMTNTSQSLNASYGYLWWLNGKQSFKLPGTTFTFPGMIIPNAPPDLICGLGKYDQKLYVWPSQGMVIVRMGWDADTTSEVPIVLDTLIWKHLNRVFCNQPNGLAAAERQEPAGIYPNPASDRIFLQQTEPVFQTFILFDSRGKTVKSGVLLKNTTQSIPLGGVEPGLYWIQLSGEGTAAQVQKIQINH